MKNTKQKDNTSCADYEFERRFMVEVDGERKMSEWEPYWPEPGEALPGWGHQPDEGGEV